nr:HAMP domain-containing sensor histidine kinase [Mediterraneibacter massiliensis]
MLDTKSKNKSRQGILILFIVVCLCAAGMLSTYRMIGEDMESVSIQQNAWNDVYYGMADDLCEGNYFLYNEYSQETDKADILSDYMESNFLLLRKYMDCGLFDRAGESLLENLSADVSENLQEEDTGYAFRAEFTFQEDGDLSDISVTGTKIDEETQYYAQKSYLKEMENTEISYWSDISTPQGVTVIYGMTEENLNAYADSVSTTRFPSAYNVIAYSRMLTFAMLFAAFAAAAALLLPFRHKFDIGNAAIFTAPLEVVLCVLWFLYISLYPAASVVLATINQELPQIVQGQNSLLNDQFAICINFLMWFLIYLAVYWVFTCLRAVFTMKREYFIKRTLTAKVIGWLKDGGGSIGKKIGSGIKNIWKRIRTFAAKQYDSLLHLNFQDKTNRTIFKIIGINFIVLAIICSMWFFGLFALCIYSVLLFFFLKKYFHDLQDKYKVLLQSTNQLANGDLDTPLEGDLGIFAPIQEELKKIQKGFKKAVEKEVKSERMKTELITNVSHDLKTPLTAIITYTDLLKTERDEAKRKEYIDVLERKSLRLKVLIEDLFEISKAASKNVIMHYMKVDIVDLLKQVGLENDNKIKEANLEFRWKLPEHKVILNLDSQKTYRVFENLIVNITKYAMPHTRAYIEMEESDSQVRIFMKNVSATELNFNVEEITDRFVRGDSSRNTEGSGLGLAIAKSFTQLQHGELKIETEADLFKAEIIFPKNIEITDTEESDTSSGGENSVS